MSKKKPVPYESLPRERSLRACIAAGWKLFAFHLRPYLAALWMPLLAAGCGYALFSFFFCRMYCTSALPAWVYTHSGLELGVAREFFFPAPTDWLWLLLFFVAAVAGSCLARGAVFAQIKYYVREGRLPKNLSAVGGTPLRRSALRLLVFDALWTFVLAAITAVVVGIAAVTSWWVLLLLLPIYIYGAVAVNIGEQFYLLRGLSLKESLVRSFTKGNNLSDYFVLLLLTSIPMFAVAIVGLYPNILLQLAYIVDGTGRLAGDASGMPDFMPLLFFILTAIGSAVVLLARSIQLWTLAFKTGEYLAPAE